MLLLITLVIVIAFWQFAERFLKRHDEMSSEERLEMAKLAAQPERRWTHGPKFLFDLGKEATGGVTPYEMKDARDTWYSIHRVKEIDNGFRHTGGVQLSSHAYGDNLKDYHDWTKPEFARQPVIRDNFFRSTGELQLLMQWHGARLSYQCACTAIGVLRKATTF